MDRATIKMFIDQCDGMGLAGAADCIESMAAEIERLERLADAIDKRAGERIAASQAREVQLREALHYSLGAWYYDGVSNEHGSIYREANDRCDQPTDTSALEALIAKAGDVMRERCAHEADPFELKNALATDIAKGIRALPGVKLEDLK